MKKLMATVLATTLALGSCFLPSTSCIGIFCERTIISVNASEVEHGDYNYQVKSDGSVEITKYTGEGGNVTIPNVIKGKKVTSIGNYAFKYCIGRYAVVTVSIPNSVKSIGEGAFLGCDKLTGITIPNSVVSIGGNAFYGCSSLTNITIPNSVKNMTLAFYGCSNLTDINVGSKNKNYTSKDGVLFNKNITELIQYPRGNTRKSYTIPNSVKKVAFGSFYGCSNLTDINVGSKNKNYASKDGVLFNKNITELIQYPQGNTRKSYTIPNSVKIIENSAFIDCKNLSSITIPSSATSIGSSAFCGCDNLININIPKGVTEIKRETFYNCSVLTSVAIPSSVTQIGEKAFYNCSGLTDITIPDNVTQIGEKAFYNCSSLTSITIPDNVTQIHDYTFYDCSNLTNIIVPNSVKNIGEWAFGHCDNLTINCVENSFTHTYAKKNMIPYKIMKNSNKYVITTSTNEVDAQKKVKLKINSNGKTIDSQKFYWKSSNTDYATVNEKGIVTTQKAGAGKTVTITAISKSDNNVKASIKISIKNNQSISLSKSSIILSLAGTRTATLQVTAKKPSDKVTWKTSNSQVVTVKDGKLKATGKGTAIVSAKISGDTAQCKVTVKDTAVKTITYQFNSLEEWDKAVAAKEKSITFGSQAFLADGTTYHSGNIIVKREVLSYKTIPLKISLNTPGYYKTVYIKLPEKVTYTLHRHSLQNDANSESIGKLMAGLVNQQVIWTQTCSCGFKNELSWDIPIDKIEKLESEQTYTVISVSRDIDS